MPDCEAEIIEANPDKEGRWVFENQTSRVIYVNWVYGIALAAIIEILFLVFIINGYRSTGKSYAVVSFFLNAFYYDYWFVTIRDRTGVNVKLMTISLVVCLCHSLAVWQLSELFYNRLKGG